MIGNAPLIIVRPSVAIINNKGEILLYSYSGASWGIPGGILQINETVENCIKRNVKEDLGLILNSLHLFGVYSGQDLNTKPENGEDEYHTVAIGYLCTDYAGVLTPDENQEIEAEFFKLDQLPDHTDSFIKNKLVELKENLKIG
ncbi:NUDIX domain-containing protein [Metabacillus sediminilitoris]|uniref:NUDIX domain-containing protein n=1 Tax=Metabacillus sediminilitoris TaxID=2567941 RepID=A0A4S4BLK2_9BACI|nr:NUDIX domain-containing protein [Metabacillus sediminilitoris]QGQ45882.1 NUDIX domain-containing protein [Metabacillus sediminilitoris]THF75064.1 NUDIX domain-containing protein [Metabacillus sediminilitoris]